MDPITVVPQRDHHRAKTLLESGRALRKVAAAAKNTLGRKMATFHSGEFVVMVKCLKKNRSGVLSGTLGILRLFCSCSFSYLRLSCTAEAYEVVGSQRLQQALTGMVPQLLAAATDNSAASPEVEAPQEVLQEAELLQIPAGAEERAERLRKMLQEAWRHHVAGTRFGRSTLRPISVVCILTLVPLSCRETSTNVQSRYCGRSAVF